jgi:hypothetical protein
VLSRGGSVLSAALLALLILVSGIAIYFYFDSIEAERRYNTLLSELEGVALEVNLLIDYGNDSMVWHNKTFLPIGTTLLNITSKVSSSVECIGSDKGVFVNGIDGVGTKIVKKGHCWPGGGSIRHKANGCLVRQQMTATYPSAAIH